MAELEVKARQLEIELDLTIEKFGTVGIFFARHLVITIRNKFSRFVEKKYGITFWKQILWIIYSVLSFADLI